MTGLQHDGAATRRGCNTTGLQHDGAATRRGCNTTGLQHDGAATRRGCNPASEGTHHLSFGNRTSR
ncbi:hypothetical protein P7K49_012895, partial [Saguinus oedipus]